MVRASRFQSTGWTLEAHAQADQLAGSRPVLWSISMGQPPRLAQPNDQANPSILSAPAGWLLGETGHPSSDLWLHYAPACVTCQYRIVCSRPRILESALSADVLANRRSGVTGPQEHSVVLIACQDDGHRKPFKGLGRTPRRLARSGRHLTAAGDPRGQAAARAHAGRQAQLSRRCLRIQFQVLGTIERNRDGPAIRSPHKHHRSWLRRIQAAA